MEKKKYNRGYKLKVKNDWLPLKGEIWKNHFEGLLLEAKVFQRKEAH